MIDDEVLRFGLVDELKRMRYGAVRTMPGNWCRRAWKPTGDHDLSFEGTFRSLALAEGGHRPETSYTTDERIRMDLGNEFSWQILYESGDYLFTRHLDACPKCRGRGGYQAIVGDLPEFVRAEEFDPNQTVEINWVKCDHKPVTR